MIGSFIKGLAIKVLTSIASEPALDAARFTKDEILTQIAKVSDEIIQDLGTWQPDDATLDEIQEIFTSPHDSYEALQDSSAEIFEKFYQERFYDQFAKAMCGLKEDLAWLSDEQYWEVIEELSARTIALKMTISEAMRLHLVAATNRDPSSHPTVPKVPEKTSGETGSLLYNWSKTSGEA